MKSSIAFLCAFFLSVALTAQQNEIITSVPINGALGLKFGMNRAQVEDVVQTVGWIRRDAPAGLEWGYADCILLKDVVLADKIVAAEVNLCFLYDQLSTITLDFGAYHYDGFRELNANPMEPDTEEYEKISGLKSVFIHQLIESLSLKYAGYNRITDSVDPWKDPLSGEITPSIYWTDIDGNRIDLEADEMGVAGSLLLRYTFKRNHDRREMDERKKIDRDF